MASNNNRRKNRKIWGFVMVWLILFFIVKSIEKILLITAVGALVFWGSRWLRGSGENGDNRKNSLKEKDLNP